MTVLRDWAALEEEVFEEPARAADIYGVLEQLPAMGHPARVAEALARRGGRQGSGEGAREAPRPSERR